MSFTPSGMPCRGPANSPRLALRSSRFASARASSPYTLTHAWTCGSRIPIRSRHEETSSVALSLRLWILWAASTTVRSRGSGMTAPAEVGGAGAAAASGCGFPGPPGWRLRNGADPGIHSGITGGFRCDPFAEGADCRLLLAARLADHVVGQFAAQGQIERLGQLSPGQRGRGQRIAHQCDTLPLQGGLQRQIGVAEHGTPAWINAPDAVGLQPQGPVGLQLVVQQGVVPQVRGRLDALGSP